MYCVKCPAARNGDGIHDACCTIAGDDLCKEHAVEVLASMGMTERHAWYQAGQFGTMDEDEVQELMVEAYKEIACK